MRDPVGAALGRLLLAIMNEILSGAKSVPPAVAQGRSKAWSLSSSPRNILLSGATQGFLARLKRAQLGSAPVAVNVIVIGRPPRQALTFDRR